MVKELSAFTLTLSIPFLLEANDNLLGGIFGDRPIVPDDKVLNVLQNSSYDILESPSAKIIFWNIYKAKRDGLIKDLSYFIENKDFVMIQEWIENPELESLSKQLKNKNLTLAGSFWNKDNYMTGVMTASRINPIKSQWVRSEALEPFIKTPKMALLNEYYFRSLSTPVLIINIHGINRTNTDGFIRQIKQVEEKIMNYSYPIIFGGDFNTRNAERTTFFKKWAQKNGFKIVEFEQDSRPKILDYIMVRGLNIKSSKLHLDIKTSDHPAMEIEVY